MAIAIAIATLTITATATALPCRSLPSPVASWIHKNTSAKGEYPCLSGSSHGHGIFASRPNALRLLNPFFCKHISRADSASAVAIDKEALTTQYFAKTSRSRRLGVCRHTQQPGTESIRSLAIVEAGSQNSTVWEDKQVGVGQTRALIR
jgi:hypothetical protein